MSFLDEFTDEFIERFEYKESSAIDKIKLDIISLDYDINILTELIDSSLHSTEKNDFILKREKAILQRTELQISIL